MSDFKSRLKTEQEELADKVTKLGNFINSEAIESLPFYHQELLKSQYLHMDMYNSILIKRLKLLT